jgi:hypothetical protein
MGTIATTSQSPDAPPVIAFHLKAPGDPETHMIFQTHSPTLFTAVVPHITSVEHF